MRVVFASAIGKTGNPKTVMSWLSLSRRSLRVRFAVGSGLLGFAVGVCLWGYAFYLTGRGLVGDERVFLVLCPPSIGAIALDNVGVFRGAIGWLIITIENACLYMLVGFVIGLFGEHRIADTRLG